MEVWFYYHGLRSVSPRVVHSLSGWISILFYYRLKCVFVLFFAGEDGRVYNLNGYVLSCGYLSQYVILTRLDDCV